MGGQQTVAIACKVQGFALLTETHGGIASRPLRGTTSYFVSADAFYNNGAASGRLHGTPFADPGVPDC
jgi:hypothetical protein